MRLIPSLLLLLFLLAGRAQDLPEVGRERVRLVGNGGGELKLQINDATPVALSNLLPERVLRKGPVAIAMRENDWLSLRSEGRPMIVESTAFPNWRVDVPAGNPLHLRPRLAQGALEIEQPGENNGTLELVFRDGARAKMNPSGRGRVEWLDDGTYSFRAGTNVSGVSADGLRIVFADWNPWLTGGPLREERLPDGSTRLVRRDPAVPVEFLGAPDREVRLRVEGREVVLAPEQDRLITFRNGGAVMMRHSLSRQALEWRVTKGLCHFRIDGFGCWKGIAGAGESGSLRWNASRKLADLSNTGDQPVLAQLSGRVTAGIFPGATFQYAQLQDCGSFVTTASGGRTALFERDTGEVNFIEQAPAAYSEGHRSETAGAQRRWVPLSFSWEKDDRVQVRGVSGPVQVTAGAERTIQFNQDQMHVQYAKSGDLTFRALKGNFEVKPDFVEEFSFEVPETGALVLNLDRRRWVLSARAAEDSGVVIRSIASGETYMYLAGEAKITVHPGQRTFFPEGTAAWIFFEGAGGESDFAIGPQPGLVISPDRFDSSRIPQQPVSVIE